MSDQANEKPIKKIVENRWNIATFLTRPEGEGEDWCNTCLMSSLLKGLVWTLMNTGVQPWGTVKGCPQCDTWVWTNIKGEIVNVEKY